MTWRHFNEDAPDDRQESGCETQYGTPFRRYEIIMIMIMVLEVGLTQSAGPLGRDWTADERPGRDPTDRKSTLATKRDALLYVEDADEANREASPSDFPQALQLAEK